MKEYTVVTIDDNSYNAYSDTGNSFSGIMGNRGHAYILNWYARQGWHFVQAVRDYTESLRKWYLYFEREAQEQAQQ